MWISGIWAKPQGISLQIVRLSGIGIHGIGYPLNSGGRHCWQPPLFVCLSLVRTIALYVLFEYYPAALADHLSCRKIRRINGNTGQEGNYSPLCQFSIKADWSVKKQGLPVGQIPKCMEKLIFVDDIDNKCGLSQEIDDLGIGHTDTAKKFKPYHSRRKNDKVGGASHKTGGLWLEL